MIKPKLPSTDISQATLGQAVSIFSSLPSSTIEKIALLTTSVDITQELIKIIYLIIKVLLILITLIIISPAEDSIRFGNMIDPSLGRAVSVLLVTTFIAELFIFFGGVPSWAFKKVRDHILNLRHGLLNAVAKIRHTFARRQMNSEFDETVDTESSGISSAYAIAPPEQDSIEDATSAGHTNQTAAVVIEPTETSPETADLSETYNRLVKKANRVDLRVTLSDGPIRFLSSFEKKTEYVYIVTAEGMKAKHLQKHLATGYPDDYLIRKEAVQFPHQMSREQASYPSEQLRSVEYKTYAESVSADTLTPLKPATERYDAENSIGPITTRPLAEKLSIIDEHSCSGYYHIKLTNNDVDGQTLRSLAKSYANEKQYKLHTRYIKKHRAENPVLKTPDTELAQEQADALRNVKSAAFTTVDPRFVIWGPDSERVLNRLRSKFGQVSRSVRTVKGRGFCGRRAEDSYRRTVGASSVKYSKRLQKKLRSPQSRIPGIKGLTPNRSTQFVVSEYTLPYFISAEPAETLETGQLFYRRSARNIPKREPQRT